MARHLSPCSSSSSISFSPSSSFKHETPRLFSRFVVVPRKSCFSIWVSQIRSRIHARKNFKLKSSNGHPLNAVSLQDGLAGNHLAKESIESQGKEISSSSPESEKVESTLSITVVGASGDLAKKKIFPAHFALFYEDCLPENFTVFGYARTKLTDEELRNMISKTLTCRIDKRENCGDKMDQFLKRCFYHSGLYSILQNWTAS